MLAIYSSTALLQNYKKEWRMGNELAAITKL